MEEKDCMKQQRKEGINVGWLREQNQGDTLVTKQCDICQMNSKIQAYHAVKHTPMVDCGSSNGVIAIITAFLDSWGGGGVTIAQRQAQHTQCRTNIIELDLGHLWGEKWDLSSWNKVSCYKFLNSSIHISWFTHGSHTYLQAPLRRGWAHQCCAE